MALLVPAGTKAILTFAVFTEGQPHPGVAPWTTTVSCAVTNPGALTAAVRANGASYV